ncbi:MAG TPA: hypothetical protein VIU11_02465 [Nakamurella sp.]
MSVSLATVELAPTDAGTELTNTPSRAPTSTGRYRRPTNPPTVSTAVASSRGPRPRAGGIMTVFLALSVSVDGYIAPDRMTMEHAHDPAYRDWASPLGAAPGLGSRHDG